MINRIYKVEASAGSGKTYQLSLEYLSKLFLNFHIPGSNNFTDDRGRISSILAITFTNKAANEMKERVILRLKNFSYAKNFQELSDDDRVFLKLLSQKTSIPERVVLDRSILILNSIIDNYSDFNIKTIDSLMNSIIKVLSPDLDLSVDYETGISIKEELNQEIRKYLDELVKTRWDLVEEFLLDFKNTHPISGWNLDESICEKIAELSDKALYKEKKAGQINENDIEGLREKIARSLELFRKSLTDFYGIIDSNEGRQHRHNSKVGKSLIEKISLFINDNGYFGSLIQIEDFISKKFLQYPEAVELFKKSASDDLIDKTERVYIKLKTALANLLINLSVFRLIHYHRFFKQFSEFWEKNKKRIYVSEFSQKIRDKFEEWDSIFPYLYLKLSDRYQHILIDEFQDTSRLQFEALFPIIKEILCSEESSSFFVVGDRKQAIYRWRGGDSDLMLKEIFQNNSSTLQSNWRSGKGIIDFNNEFWEPQNISSSISPGSLKNKILNNFDNSQQKNGSTEKSKDGFVKVRINLLDSSKDNPTSKDSPEKILFQEILQDVKLGLSHGLLAGDIAILVRKGETGRKIIRFLIEHNIEAISDESLLLSSSKFVNEIVCFLRFLEYPPDNLSFYTFIKGNIFQSRAKKISPLYESILNDLEIIKAENKIIYKLFKQKYPDLWEMLIKPFFNAVGFLPAYDIFQDFTSTYSLYENFEGSVPFFMTFASMLYDLELKGKNSLSSFLDEWDHRKKNENEYAIDIAEDHTRVKVLTIHKSKGLEFPMVIVPLTDSDGGKNSIYSSEGEFYYIKQSYWKHSEKLKKIYQEDVVKEYIDNLNLLYVAFTRPSQILSIPVVIKEKKKSKKSEEDITKFPGFGQLIRNHPMFSNADINELGWLGAEIGKIPHSAGKKQLAVNENFKIKSKNVLTAKWVSDFLVFDAGVYSKKNEEEAPVRGKLFHQIFERLTVYKTRVEISIKLKALCKEEAGLSEVDQAIIQSFFNRSDVAPFFVGDFEYFNEKDILCNIDNVPQKKRIDRLLLMNKKFVVIDYKTGGRKDKDLTQIQVYTDALKEIFPEYSYSAFLLYIDLDEVVRVKC